MELYGHDGGGTRQEYYSAFKLPFNAIITTNFDPLLRDAADNNCRVTYSYPDISAMKAASNDKSAFYIHGIADRNKQPENQQVVFTKSDYTEAYDHYAGPTSLFLKSVFMECRGLFIGAELESSVEKCLEAVSKMKALLSEDDKLESNRTSGSSRHGFILLAEKYTTTRKLDEEYIIKSDPEAKRDLAYEDKQKEDLARLGISVIRYEQESRHHHSELKTIFKSLVEKSIIQPSRLTDEETVLNV